MKGRFRQRGIFGAIWRKALFVLIKCHSRMTSGICLRQNEQRMRLCTISIQHLLILVTGERRDLKELCQCNNIETDAVGVLPKNQHQRKRLVSGSLGDLYHVYLDTHLRPKIEVIKQPQSMPQISTVRYRLPIIILK